MKLTGKQRRHLRALGHHLPAIVQVGKSGVTPSVEGAVSEALLAHELIKVRCGTECPELRTEVADRLAAATRAETVQQLGRTILLYRRHPNEPKIELPRSKAPKA